jgi:hypothetical protein
MNPKSNCEDCYCNRNGECYSKTFCPKPLKDNRPDGFKCPLEWDDKLPVKTQVKR